MSNIKYRDDNGDFVDLIDPLDYYPVGSLYLSYDSTSPADLFGGTWNQMTGRFLYMGNNTSTGGSEKHSHQWGFTYRAFYGLIAEANDPELLIPINWNEDGGKDWNHKASAMAQYQISKRNWGIDSQMYSGPDIRVTNMDAYANTEYRDWKPPYQTVYCWRRTA